MKSIKFFVVNLMIGFSIVGIVYLTGDKWVDRLIDLILFTISKR